MISTAPTVCVCVEGGGGGGAGGYNIICLSAGSYKPSSPILNFFRILVEEPHLGDTAVIFQNRENKSPLCCLFNILRTLIKIMSQETKNSICLSTHVANMCSSSRHV